MFNIFINFFISILRNVAIPIVAILFMQSSFLGLKGAVLAVTIALTIINIFSIIEHLIVLLPNVMLFKTRRIINIFIKIFVEIVSPLGFWIFYFSRF